MEENGKSLIIPVLRQLMKPIIRFMLQNGVSYREFTNMCKYIFVEVATEDYGIRGRPANMSRVAVLTGLDRKEVKRVRDSGDLDTHLNEVSERRRPPDHIANVLTGWHTDKAFLDSEQLPKVIPYKGDDVSFESLVQRYSGDVPATTIFKELKLAEAVAELPDGKVRILKRAYIPPAGSPEAIGRLGSILKDLSETIHHNFCRAETEEQKWFERRAHFSDVNKRYVNAFHTFLKKEGQGFLEKVDAWLDKHRIKDTQSKTVRLGIGLYTIQGKGRVE